MTKSLLDDVPGVGPKRRDALLAHFSSVDQLRAADLDELAAVPGVGRSAAAAVKAYFDPAALDALDAVADDPLAPEGGEPGGDGLDLAVDGLDLAVEGLDLAVDELEPGGGAPREGAALP
jgi:hypothetical protein